MCKISFGVYAFCVKAINWVQYAWGVGRFGSGGGVVLYSIFCAHVRHSDSGGCGGADIPKID